MAYSRGRRSRKPEMLVGGTDGGASEISKGCGAINVSGRVYYISDGL
ncbi:MAG: hypothetical protein HC942_01970 [Microcoleus sp. SU_5_6]|nr:hypothetical protein [Microcoleus sp. SU_5_6]